MAKLHWYGLSIERQRDLFISLRGAREIDANEILADFGVSMARVERRDARHGNLVPATSGDPRKGGGHYVYNVTYGVRMRGGKPNPLQGKDYRSGRGDGRVHISFTSNRRLNQKQVLAKAHSMTLYRKDEDGKITGSRLRLDYDIAALVNPTWTRRIAGRVPYGSTKRGR